MKIGILASHEGSTLQSIIDASRDGRLPAQVVVVISNNRGSKALARATDAGIPACNLSSRTHPEPSHLDDAICQTLLKYNTDVVFLAGYLKRIGPVTLRQFTGRILNTHPALLPKYGGKGMYGRRVHEAVLLSGDHESGVSIHIVDAEYDSGPVVAQTTVPVEPNDTVESLSERVHARELEFIVEALNDIVRGKIRLPGW